MKNFVQIAKTKYLLKGLNEFTIQYIFDIFKSSVVNQEDNSVQLYANSITKPHSLLDYKLCIDFIFCLKRQQEFMEKHSSSFYYFSPDEILVINDNIFISTSPIEPIDSQGILKLYRPYNRNKITVSIFSPELKLNILPAFVSHKTAYYSLGVMAILFMFGSDDIELLSQIAHTKLYWFLRRCINKLPEDRYLIYV